MNNKIFAYMLLVLVAILCLVAWFEFGKMKNPDLIIPSSSITKIMKLSDYFEGIKNSNGDADVYIFESGVPGSSILLLGGTHPNEPAGFIAAVTLIENMKVEKGRVLIIPQACLSGFSYNDPMEATPQFFHIKTKSGERKFRFGSRVASPLDQWPDPLVYTHHPSGQNLSGVETRNLNRSYPGRADGSFSEKIGYAIVQLIQKEKIDLAFDLHEAAPEIPIINAIVYHEKCEDIALNAVLTLDLQDMKYAPEKSPENFHGLSHREWGDKTDVLPFLMETSNPIQGRFRGKTDENLIIEGVSNNYKRALESGKLRIEYDPEGEPLWKRVGRHLEGFNAIVNSYNEYYPDKNVIIVGIPGFDLIKENGIGYFLH